MEIVGGMLSLPIRPAHCEEESGTWGVCVCMRARKSKEAGRVKCMRTSKAEWARGSKEK